MKIKAFFRLIRVYNLLIVMLAGFIAFNISGLCGSPLPFLRLMIPIILLAAFSNSFNDLMDARLDQDAHPDRPIPKGDISITEATIFNIVLGLLTFASSFLFHRFTTQIIFLIGLALAILYDIYFKKVCFIGNLIVSLLTSFPFLLLALEIGNFSLMWYPVLCAILYNLIREALKDTEDFPNDSKYGYKTLPFYLKEKGVKIYATFLLFALIFSTVFAYRFTFHSPVFLAYMTILWIVLGLRLWREKSFSKLSVYFKEFMIFVILGFWLGGAL